MLDDSAMRHYIYALFWTLFLKVLKNLLHFLDTSIRELRYAGLFTGAVFQSPMDTLSLYNIPVIAYISSNIDDMTWECFKPYGNMV